MKLSTVLLFIVLFLAPDTPQPKFMTLDQTSVNITWTPYRLIDVDYVLEYRLAGTTTLN